MVDFIDTVTHARNLELLLESIIISEGSPLAGLTIEEGGRVRTGATILAIKKGDDTLLMNPPKETFIEPGDQLVVIGTRDQLRIVEGSA